MRNEFSEAVRTAIEESIEIGYRPTFLIQMLENRHAVEVAKSLVVQSTIQDGFRRMHEHGRLDLTIESIMLEPRFASLFTEGELEAARWRLKQAQPLL